MHCREERKHRISELEKRTEEIQKLNQQYAAEIAHLKTIILAHENCPLSLAIKNQSAPISRPNDARSQRKPMFNMPFTSPSPFKPAVSTKTSTRTVEEPPQKLIILNKGGLKQRRQAAQGLTFIGNMNNSKTDSVGSTSSNASVSIIRPKQQVIMERSVASTIGSSISDVTQVTSTSTQEVLTESSMQLPQNSMLRGNNGNSMLLRNNNQIISTGLQQVLRVNPSNKEGMPMSIIVPTKHLISSKPSIPKDPNFTMSQVLKLNPNIPHTCLTVINDPKQMNNSGNASSAMSDTSMDSGHGSDIEILVEIPSNAEPKI